MSDREADQAAAECVAVLDRLHQRQITIVLRALVDRYRVAVPPPRPELVSPHNFPPRSK